jgi:hypothetical protein
MRLSRIAVGGEVLGAVISESPMNRFSCRTASGRDVEEAVLFSIEGESNFQASTK